MATKAKSKMEVNEELKLRWPDGAERTRIKDRVGQTRWKKSWSEGKKALSEELIRLGATSILITRGPDDRLDPGVAVWFSRAHEDYSWQQGLGLESPAPRLEEIDTAFKQKARVCHPDSPGGGDIELYKRLVEWRNAAKAWVTGTHGHAHEYVMAIDQYNEARLNLKALQMAFFYIRRLEDVGAPAILTQTLGAFRAKLTATATVATGGAA